MTSWSRKNEIKKNGPAQKSRLDRDLNGPKEYSTYGVPTCLDENLKLAKLEF